MGKRLNSTVWVRAEDGGIDMVSFGPDDDKIPAWARKQMGDHCFEDDGEDHEDEADDAAQGDEPAKPYSEWKKADLEAEVASRNEGRDDDDLIEVEAPGNKAELVAALEADDAAQGDD